MADFKESRKKFTDARHLFEEASRAVYLAKQQNIILDKQVDQELKKQLLPTLPANHPLSAQKTKTLATITESQTKLNAASIAMKSARQELESAGPVSQTIANLDNATPILLLPLKLQTRFLTTKYIARNIPDEQLVNVNELEESVRSRIVRMFHGLPSKADPFAGKQSQAYSLSHDPSTDAKKIISVLNPHFRFGEPKNRWQKVEDSFELSVRIFPDDIFLKNHEPALTENELASGKKFWQAMWAAERLFRKTPNDAQALKKRNEEQLAAWKTLRFETVAHRAAWIARVLRPTAYPDNLSPDLEKLTDAHFPAIAIKAEPWTIPPGTNVLPEHFVVKLFFNGTTVPAKEVTGAAIPDFVQLGFDPDEQDLDSFSESGRTLRLPKELRWLTDLSEAEKCGMAVRIPLTKVEMDAGISKLVVLGVKTSADMTEGAQLLSGLLDDHHFKPDGAAFLKQGTSTNNISGKPSGFKKGGLNDEESFAAEFAPLTAINKRSDSGYLSMALGLKDDVFLNLQNQEGLELRQALQVNRALWNGTIGYYLENVMRPAATTADIEFIKSFFREFVSARGLFPVLRLGKQPYGIIPAMAWAAYSPALSASKEESRLAHVLKKLDVQWNRLSNAVRTMKSVFAITDEQTLKREFRELLTYQASSSRYFRRLVAGEYLLWNINEVAETSGVGKTGIFTPPVEFKARVEAPAEWNEALNPSPRMIHKFLDDDNYKLLDAAPEDVGILQQLTDKGKNYLALLVTATPEQIRTNAFGENFSKHVNQRSSRLMFHMAKFALSQAWIKAAIGVLKKDGKNISPLAHLDFEFEYLSADTIPSVEHTSLLAAAGMAGTFETRKNKWAFLEETLSDGTRVDARITQLLTQNLTPEDPVRELQDIRITFNSLSNLPIEDLEKLFSEHIDLCSFRLDAWMQALAIRRMQANRNKPGFEKGIYLGCFGYLENCKIGQDRWIQVTEVAQPKIVLAGPGQADDVAMPVYDFSNLTPEQIVQVKKMVFVYLGSDPNTFLIEDPETKKLIQGPSPFDIREDGFVLTPSLEHAATAGILRAGYEHHSRSSGPESKTLSVSIDSERTGAAMNILKGMRAGHSLNEQLGYFIERSMYDSAALAGFIPNLRIAFPLHIERNEWDDNQNINEAQKITNLSLVTDGLAIVNLGEVPGSSGWLTKLNEIFGTDETAKSQFNIIVSQARNQFDAIGDLVLAESVYQTVKGSPEKAAAALNMIGEGTDIILPEIAQINAENRVLSHRMGFVFNTGDGFDKSWPAATQPSSVFAKLSPDLNRWLAEQLPAPQSIVVLVTSKDRLPIKVSMLDLGIQPIDFYYLIQKTGRQLNETLLPWLVSQSARKKQALENNIALNVSFERDASFTATEYSIQELLPLIRTITSLLQNSRPLRPVDFISLSSAVAGVTETLDLTNLRTACTEISATAATASLPVFIQKLEAAQTKLEQNFPTGLGSPQSDSAFFELLNLLPQGYLFGLWDAGPRIPEENNQANARVLIDQVYEMITLLENRLTKAAALNATAASLPPTTDGNRLFQQLSDCAKTFTGEDFLILPRFRISNSAEILATQQDAGLKESIGEFGVEEWLQSLAMVRDNVRNLQSLLGLRELFKTTAANRTISILQLPHVPGGKNSWIAKEFPEGFQPPPSVTSMAFEFSAVYKANDLICGILTDDWREKLPLREFTAGASINYNQANSEAAQCMLLAISADQKGPWVWETLVNTVLETMNMARKRAVDSEILQSTWLSQFLPAIVAPVDAKNNTPNLDFRMAGPPIKKVPVVDRPDLTGLGGAVFDLT